MSCQIENEFDDFSPTLFQNTKQIQWVHNNVPRFGKTNDILALVTGSAEEGNDYFIGLLASSIAMFSVFLIWACILLCMKCKGPETFGWFSGRRLPFPPRPNSSKGVVEEPADQNEAEPVEESPIGDDGDLQMPDKMLAVDKDGTEWDIRYAAVQRQHKFMKMLVFFACLMIVIGSILMSVKG
jgi:hypothetical protein